MRTSADADILGRLQGEPDNPSAPWAGAAPPGHAEHTGTLVRTLQRDLIPRLARAYRPTLAQLTPQDVESFVTDLLEGSEPALLARLDSLRKRGFSNDALCMDLLAPAARRLGSLWDEDRCDFTAVTIGVGQLQRLMRLLGPSAAVWPASGEPAFSLLLAQAPQEQHSFGLTMVAEFFRSAGWAVSGGMGESEAHLLARVQAQPFDVVGFSVGGLLQLDWLRTQVSAVRRSSPNPQLVVMVGGPLFHHQPNLAADVGADLCATSAREAPGLAERLVRDARSGTLQP